MRQGGSRSAPAGALERLEAAVHFILERQNADGGFGTYERRRGPRFLERLNPSEMFGDCMTELSYIECTASAVIALCRFREQHPDRLSRAIDRAIARAVPSCVAAAGGRLLAGLLGHQLHLRDLVRGQRAAQCGRERQRSARSRRAAQWLIG